MRREDLRSKPVSMPSSPGARPPPSRERTQRGAVTEMKSSPVQPPPRPGPSPAAPRPPPSLRSRGEDAPPEGTPLTVAVVGRFRPWPWGRVPDEAHLASALSLAGAVVHKVEEDGPRPDVAAEWALFTARPSSWARMPEWALGRRTVLWTVDLLPRVAERAPALEAARSATLVATADRFDWRGVLGIRSHVYLPAACDPYEPPFSPRPERTCAFVGTPYSGRRLEIARVVRSLGGLVVGGPGSWLSPAALADLVQGTKVVVGDNLMNDVDGYWSPRNYVVPGAGGFLLSPCVPGIGGGLCDAAGVGLYDSVSRLADEVVRWCGRDEEREAARRRAFGHVRASHTWAARAAALLSAMRERTPRRLRPA